MLLSRLIALSSHALLSSSLLSFIRTPQCFSPLPSNPELFVTKLFEKHATSVGLPLAGLEAVFTAMGLLGGTEEAHDDHDDHRRRREATGNISCIDPLALANSFGMTTPLTQDEFSQLAVGIVALVDSGACVASSTASASTSTKPSSGERWSYSFLATIFVSLASLSGLLVLVCTGKHGCAAISGSNASSSYASQMLLTPNVKLTMLALAVGALVGDSILHLLPSAFGLHEHDVGGDHAGHEEEEEGDPYLPMWRGCLALLGIYCFAALEIFLSRCGHSHNKGNSDEHAYVHVARQRWGKTSGKHMESNLPSLDECRCFCITGQIEDSFFLFSFFSSFFFFFSFFFFGCS